MTTDFVALLGTNMDEVERPVPLPEGHYMFTVMSHTTGESAKKKTPFLEFELQVVNPMSDVDQEELAKIKDWAQKKMRFTCWLTENAQFGLKDFFQHCGLEIEGRTFDAVLPETTGQQVIGSVAHRIHQDDPTIRFAEVKRTVAAFQD